MAGAAADYAFDGPHLLGLEGLNPLQITSILDLADRYADLARAGKRGEPRLAGKTVINRGPCRASRSPPNGSAPMW